jgi:hypothetical protein
MPRPSTTTLRVLPFFPPICGIGADSFLGEGGFGLAPINALPYPGNALHLIIFHSSGLPEPEKDPRGLPLEKIAMNGARTAKAFFGQRVPLNPRPEDEYHPCKHLTGR